MGLYRSDDGMYLPECLGLVMEPCDLHTPPGKHDRLSNVADIQSGGILSALVMAVITSLVIGYGDIGAI